MNYEFVYTYKRGKTPSLKAVVLTPLIYLFGSSVLGGVLGFTIGFWSIAIDIPSDRLFSSGIVQFVELLFCLTITVFLVKKYSDYLFSGSWRKNFASNLITGFKWSVPFIILRGIGVINPETRGEWLKHYLKVNNFTLENITIITAILISAGLLVVTLLEELIFRGMIQQYIKKFVNPRISVFTTAGIFTLAHFGTFFFIPVSLGLVGYWFAGGLFTGFAFNKTNSCISSFVPHLVVNIHYIIIIPLMLIS